MAPLSHPAYATKNYTLVRECAMGICLAPHCNLCHSRGRIFGLVSAGQPPPWRPL